MLLWKIILMLTLFTITQQIGFAQTKEIDSLRLLVSKSKKDDNKKVDLLNELSYNLYLSGLYDSSLHYGKTGLVLAQKINYLSGQGFAAVNIGCSYLDQYYLSKDQKDLAEYSNYASKASEIARQTGDKKLTGFTYHLRGARDMYTFNYLDALEKWKRALDLYQQAGDKKLMALIERNFCALLVSQSNYPEALNYGLKSLKHYEEVKDDVRVAESSNMIGDIYMHLGSHEDALLNYRECIAIYKRNNLEYNVAHQYANIGDTYLSIKDHSKALQSYNEALPILLKSGAPIWASQWLAPWVILGIGKCYELRGDSAAEKGDFPGSKKNFEKAQNHYTKSLKKYDSLKNDLDKAQAQIYLGDVSIKLGYYSQAGNFYRDALMLSKFVQAKNLLRDTYLGFSSMYEKTKKFNEALTSYKIYITYKDSMINEDSIKKSEGFRLQYNFDKKETLAKAEQDKKDVIANEELKKQKLVRNAFVGGFAIVLLFAGVFFSQRNKIKKGKKRSDELLLNILPAETAEELKATGAAVPKDFDEVTVLFTDFKDFTQASEKMTAHELVNEINFYFSEFDNIISKYGIEKIKTIGDSYMAAGGLPVANKSNAVDTVAAALEIQAFMQSMNEQKQSKGKIFFEIRIGINTGPVVAGIVGIKKFAYDIWGDTVNIASRIESSGEAGKVNISGVTYERVKDKFSCTYRGKIHAKHKGEIDMYFVEKAKF